MPPSSESPDPMRVLQSNLLAVEALASTVRTTLGPAGAHKLLVSAGPDQTPPSVAYSSLPRTQNPFHSNFHCTAQGNAAVMAEFMQEQVTERELLADGRRREAVELTTTNDGATILSLLPVVHPAARLLLQVAQGQDQAIGDGTTTVVLLAAALLREATTLVQKGLHERHVIAGYRLACAESVRLINGPLGHSASAVARLLLRDGKEPEEQEVGSETDGDAMRDSDDLLLAIAETCLSSKLAASEAADAESHLRHVSNMAVTAYLATQKAREAVAEETRSSGRASLARLVHYSSVTGSVLCSRVVDGFLFPNTCLAHRLPSQLLSQTENSAEQSPPLRVLVCRLTDFGETKSRMWGTRVLAASLPAVDAVSTRKADLLAQFIDKVVDMGVGVVVNERPVPAATASLLCRRGIAVLHLVPRNLALAVAESTQATLVTSTADLSQDMIGSAASLRVREYGSDRLVELTGCAGQSACSVLLAGHSQAASDELKRAFHDVMCVLVSLRRSERLVAGGGALHVALAVRLRQMAAGMAAKSSLAVLAFATALEEIPVTLAANGGMDAAAILALLRHRHRQEDGCSWGIDFSLPLGAVADVLRTGSAIEPAAVALHSISSASEAAELLLRMDHIVCYHRGTM